MAVASIGCCLGSVFPGDRTSAFRSVSHRGAVAQHPWRAGFRRALVGGQRPVVSGGWIPSAWSLQRVDGDSLSSSDFPQRRLAATGSGKIALALEDGLALFDAQSAQRIGLVRPSRRGSESDRIDALEVTSDGSLWLTVDQSVVRYRPDQDEWQVIWDNPSRLSGSGQTLQTQGGRETSAGEVWLATQHGLRAGRPPFLISRCSATSRPMTAVFRRP